MHPYAELSQNISMKSCPTFGASSPIGSSEVWSWVASGKLPYMRIIDVQKLKKFGSKTNLARIADYLNLETHMYMFQQKRYILPPSGNTASSSVMFVNPDMTKELSVDSEVVTPFRLPELIDDLFIDEEFLNVISVEIPLVNCFRAAEQLMAAVLFRKKFTDLNEIELLGVNNLIKNWFTTVPNQPALISCLLHEMLKDDMLMKSCSIFLFQGVAACSPEIIQHTVSEIVLKGMLSMNHYNRYLNSIGDILKKLNENESSNNRRGTPTI